MGYNLEYQADRLIAKIRHYLITTIGRVNEQASDEEFYRAFSYAFREEIMINWLATAETRVEESARTLYYLSMEYLPGRIFSNNISNMCAVDLVKLVLMKLNRDFRAILAKEPDPGLGNGGLGRLASCLLDSLATHHYPVRAYGLRYQYGIFEQQIVDNRQIEAPDTWLLNENPWDFRRDLKRQTVKFCGWVRQRKNERGEEVYELFEHEEIYALPYDIPIVGYSKHADFSVSTLRLWSTKESPRNFKLQKYNAGRLDQAAENTTLTDVLYPADYHDAGRRTRLKQEFLLVSASLQDLISHYLSFSRGFRDFPDRVQIQINDTHPSLVIPELIRLLMKTYNLPWQEAVEITRSCTGYTNHTILKEALEEWDQQLMGYLLPRQLKIVERLNWEFCNSVRKVFPLDEERVKRMSIIEGGRVKMSHLALVGSSSVNGVAELHTEILQERLFRDFYELYPERFFNVTNGVTQRRWLLNCNPELSRFISERIGEEWKERFETIQALKRHAEESGSQEEFLSIKQKKKEEFLHHLKFEEELHHPDLKYLYPKLDLSSIFDMQIKRFHEYKRQLLNVLHIIMLYNEIRSNRHHDRLKRTFIFSGKAAPSYEAAKNIIHLICNVAKRINRDEEINHWIKIVFVENYNVSKAMLLIPAADLSEQISCAGMEASGTGNMKLAMNGALTIGTRDGANIEMEEEVGSENWPFAFVCSAEEIEAMRGEKSYKPWELLDQDLRIKQAVEMLKDRSFAESEEEHRIFNSIYETLLSGERPDYYFVLKDLRSYYETQKKVDGLYKNTHEWAKFALYNIAGMGKFSTDRAVEDYNQKIWMLNPCPPSKKLLEKIRQEYSEHDQCRIY